MKLASFLQALHIAGLWAASDSDTDALSMASASRCAVPNR